MSREHGPPARSPADSALASPPLPVSAQSPARLSESGGSCAPQAKRVPSSWQPAVHSRWAVSWPGRPLLGTHGGTRATRFSPDHAGPPGSSSANGGRDAKRARGRHRDHVLGARGPLACATEPPFLLPPHDRLGARGGDQCGCGPRGRGGAAQAPGRGGDYSERRFRGTGGSGFHPADLGIPREMGGR